MEFNETWQEARSQRPLPSLCFRGDQKNKMTALSSDWRDMFDFSSETAERNSPNLERKQYLNVLYQVCICIGPISKQKWPPWPIPEKGGTLYSEFSTPPKHLHGFEWNLAWMLYYKSKSACGEIIHVWNIFAEFWPLKLRFFLHILACLLKFSLILAWIWMKLGRDVAPQV